jgi:hypothetical protein
MAIVANLISLFIENSRNDYIDEGIGEHSITQTYESEEIIAANT